MIPIDYFSDILCVWAYGGQVRLDELQREFTDQILVRHRFMPLFADTQTRIAEGWKDKDGFAGFGKHTQKLCSRWEHTRLDSSVWTECRPTTCITSHVFLKAASLALDVDQPTADSDRQALAMLDQLVTDVRNAFFEQAIDVSRMSVLFDRLGATDIPPDAVRDKIENGEAYASLHRDHELAKSYGVLGSPTYVFNDGRQMLYGNVGYRIIDANLRELLSCRRLEGEPSWC